ncbi:MAG: hypothetical protein H7338_07520 [Candidatus Sericytochromatia bacterium]|nr:hypothetical protein [Candidatus Sericytochromatia bacterium]
MTSHRQLYDTITETYVRLRGQDVDRNWRAFLWCASVRPDVWAKVQPHVDIAQSLVDWDGIERAHWSGGEQLLIALAKSLYRNQGAVDVADFARLDGELWSAALRALKLHRGDRL